MKFHYTEAFYSVQGEGQRMGCASVFLRMFGCNFRCKSFGCDAIITDKMNPDVAEVFKNIDSYETISDLPLVKTGCDSYVAVYPEFKRFVQKHDAQELADVLTDLTPNKNWHGIDLVVTGGEPLLGWQKGYPELFEILVSRGLREVTFETNTTQMLTSEFKEWLQHADVMVTFSCSPKLSVSGELKTDAIKPDVAVDYKSSLHDMYFKFVVSPDQDMEEVERVIEEYKTMGVEVPIYLMPVGGCFEEYKENTKRVAEFAMERGLRYSPRLHIDLFGNQWST